MRKIMPLVPIIVATSAILALLFGAGYESVEETVLAASDGIEVANDQDDDPNSPPPKGVKLDLKLSVVQVGSVYYFEVTGTTSLPKGTQLRARVFALQELDFGGEKVLDEEPLLYDDPYTGEKGFTDYETTGPELKVRVHGFSKNPYSLPYRVRLFYHPDKQEEAIQEKASLKMFSGSADLQHGSDETLRIELAATVKELDGELREVADLYNNLQKQFVAISKKEFDSQKWDAWKKRWQEKVDVMRTRNLKRFNLWAVWIERQGKLRIEGFCDRFDDLAKQCEQYLEGDKEALRRAQLRLQTFRTGLEEAREVIGIDSPIDPAQVRELLYTYEKNVVRLRELARANKAPEHWEKEKKNLRWATLQPLMQLLKHLPRRGAWRVKKLTESVRDVLAGCQDRFDGKDVDMVILINRHDNLLIAFQKYAGMKAEK